MTVLARHWLLALLLGACACQQAPGVQERVVAVYSRADVAELQQSPCSDDRCPHVALEDFSCPSGVRAEVLVLSGHSLPPSYLNASPEDLARVARCYRPDLIVLDTCYGFSTPLLTALAEEAPGAWVLGSTYKLPLDGLLYDEGFFQAGSPEQRARFVRTRSGKALELWRLDAKAMDTALEEVSRWEPAVLEARLARKHPNLVKVELPGEATALVPVPPERFRKR
ncbi:hypothetical protein HUW62_31210 [Myxococcus sp. AM011]|uniref:hypothetical protein n=1 Tax=Myxococcus sp. AM011 TaxID=2745200 RepID=UPI001595911D|nr:hypothetical protein [Myxococcus sp. AM011]NVJ25699.1 hypothetical protein [Myxococcus sp. AM011]